MSLPVDPTSTEDVRAACEVLIEVFQNHEHESSIRAAAATALGAAASSRALEALTSFIKSESTAPMDVKLAAIAALGNFIVVENQRALQTSAVAQ